MRELRYHAAGVPDAGGTPAPLFWCASLRFDMTLTSIQSLIATAPNGWSMWFKGAHPPPWVGPALATAGIVIGLWIIAMQWRLDRARARESRAHARAAITTPVPWPASASDHGQALRTVVREAEELMERVAEQADGHAARLERLIAEATAAEQRLGRALRAEAVAAAVVAAKTATPAATSAAAAMPPVEPKTIPRAVAAAAAAPEDPQARVIQLAEQGLAPIEIARRLDQPVGEVELILSLRRV